MEKSEMLQDLKRFLSDIEQFPEDYLMALGGALGCEIIDAMRHVKNKEE